MELDEAFRLIGSSGPFKVGWYHTLLYALLVFYNCWIIGFQLMGMIFIGHVPKLYHCKPPEGFWSNETSPVTDEGAIDECHMYQVRDGNVIDNTTDCLYGWEFESVIGETSIVTDFNLVCDDAIYAKIAQSLFMVGVLTGSVTSGQLSDFFGRKLVLHIALVLKAVSGIVMAVLWNYNALVAAWFFVGIFNQAVQISSYVMMAEMFPPEIRTISQPLVSLIWGIAVSTVVPVALLFPNWRHYQIFISVICLIGVPLWWITPESTRWLISQGRIAEAEEILHKMAKFNRIKAPKCFLSDEEDNLLNEGKTVEQSDERECRHGDVKADEAKKERRSARYSLLDVLKTPVLLRILIINMLCWFTDSIIYYGLSLNSIRLSGNKYLNVFLTCMIELPAGVIMVLALFWIGRRTAIGISFFCAGVCCIVLACLPETSGALVGISTLGKFWISFSFSMSYIFLPEITPTPVRNATIGACVMFARIGGILAPFIIYLNEVNRYCRSTSWVVPLSYALVCVRCYLRAEINLCRKPSKTASREEGTTYFLHAVTGP